MNNDVFIPSATCGYPEYCDQRQKDHPYNSSQSATYIANGTYASSKWAAVNYSGFLSQDTVRIAGLNITEFTFEEWTEPSCYSVGCVEFGYDGVLGLAPPSASSSDINRPNLLLSFLRHNLLDSSIFSLRLPLYEDQEGELLFGSINPAINRSDFVTLPVLNETSDHRYKNAWTVPASHVSFNSLKPLKVSLGPTGYAIFDIATPYIILPTTLARNITAAIGAMQGPAWLYNIPCERRQELPSFQVTMGGHEFIITAFEYVLEAEGIFVPPGVRLCVPAFMPADQFGYGREWSGIILGHPFVRGFYSKWDFGRGEVGCK